MTFFEQIESKAGDYLYLLFRLIVGGFFFFHGLGKLVPGFIGGGDIAGFAGMLGGLLPVAYAVAVGEMLVGLGVFFGFFTRLSALGGIIIMVGALSIAHFQRSLNPLTNGAELPMLFLAAFFVLLVFGAGRFSTEKAILKREVF